MQEGQLLMTQTDRDRLVTLKKAKKKLITQREAAEELGLSTRQVKRLLYALKKRGDKAVIHGLRGKPSKRRIEEAIEREKVEQAHVWRPRRSRYGELVQWDTSEHDWLEGRGEKLYLIAMIDDATSRL